MLIFLPRKNGTLMSSVTCVQTPVPSAPVRHFSGENRHPVTSARRGNTADDCMTDSVPPELVQAGKWQDSVLNSMSEVLTFHMICLIASLCKCSSWPVSSLSASFSSPCLFLQEALQSYAFLVFVVFCLMGSVYLYFILPETKNKTFMDISQSFAKINKIPVTPPSQEMDEVLSVN